MWYGSSRVKTSRDNSSGMVVVVVVVVVSFKSLPEKLIFIVELMFIVVWYVVWLVVPVE